ncbi:LOW QUALITY PROTEIN: X box binding protein 1 [Lycorma delicatula]|uniref:LOW QUALITY PROTEIN: X box binding protein 1 n=1 Tax=Lycorma delicatula TaxID=130591 RepID=UPI003F516ACF
MCSRPNLPTRTILLKSPDSNKVREVIITEIVVPDSSSKRVSFLNKMDTLQSKQSKKRRLDHLTVEEKILRKKLKNREAAQTSRDRKKARMDELEATVKRLTQENERLCENMLSLRDERDTLAKENTILHEELWRLRVEGAAAAGPAVSSYPLPKGTAAPWARHFPFLIAMNPKSNLNQFNIHSDTPSTVPSSPLPDLFDLNSWFSECCDSNLEELEDFANSLYKEALSCEQSESQKKAVVGSFSESVESKRQNADITRISVVTENAKNCQLKIKEEVEEQVMSLSSSSTPYIDASSGVIVLCPQIVNADDSSDGNNFIIIEDAVEEVCCTSDYEDVNTSSISSSDGNSSCESEGSEIISFLSVNSPHSTKVEEETNSDHGYESVDSPCSEPDQLRQLFPELW